jgi:transcriptional regulator with XRE-family HTH domain
MKLYGFLNNYIQANRERLCLTQNELSVLVSVEPGASMSRFEAGERLPNLEVLLALEIVFDRPISVLFPGLQETVIENVRARARKVLESLGDEASPQMITKYEALSRLAHPDEYQIIPLWEERE